MGCCCSSMGGGCCCKVEWLPNFVKALPATSPVGCEKDPFPKYKSTVEDKLKCIGDCFPDKCSEIESFSILVLIAGIIMLINGAYRAFQLHKGEDGITYKAECASCTGGMAGAIISLIVALTFAGYWIAAIAGFAYIVAASGYIDTSRKEENGG